MSRNSNAAPRDETGYVDKMHKELKELEEEFDALMDKAKASEAGLRAKLVQQGNELRSKRDEAKAKLNELAEASEERWQDAREEAERVWKAFQNSVHYFRSHFK